MRKLLFALAALIAVGTIAPVGSASAQTVVVKERHHDRGLHRGEARRHHAKVVVVKRNRGHHYGWERRHHRRHHHHHHH